MLVEAKENKKEEHKKKAKRRMKFKKKKDDQSSNKKKVEGKKKNLKLEINSSSISNNKENGNVNKEECNTKYKNKGNNGQENRKRKSKFKEKQQVDQTNQAENKKEKFVISYPYKGSSKRKMGVVRIQQDDFNCLNPGLMLSDAIINFYLKYLFYEHISEVDHTNFHFFNTFFYSNLQSLSSDHEKLKRWTNKLDLYCKNFWIFPVNFDFHWTLIIVCYPQNPKIRTILVLDSLKKSFKNSILSPLKKFILVQDGYNTNNSANSNTNSNNNKNTNRKNKKSKKITKLKTVICKVPQQKNNIDCGVFLLEFAENFLSSIPTKEELSSKDFTYDHLNWFKVEKIKEKRKKITNLLNKIFELQKRKR